MDGIIVINKPKGCTSHDIVYKVKKITGEKVGHTGTLDPSATGVLPILIGRGTLLSKYLINHDKTYQVTLKLGKRTNTADSEGSIIETKKVDESILEEDKVSKVLNSFIGKQEQIPPIYSAIKINGKKLYEYARRGEQIEVKPRKIEIYNIKVINIDRDNLEIEFEVSCSKGTYIRSLCEDIAEKIGTVGYMKELKRTKVGDFYISDAVTLEELVKTNKDSYNQFFWEKHVISIESMFKDKPSVILTDYKLKLFLNGVKLKTTESNSVCRIYDETNRFIGIGRIENNILKRDISIKDIEKN